MVGDPLIYMGELPSLSTDPIHYRLKKMAVDFAWKHRL